MFRLEQNVPNVYVNDSRDFQLLCRVFDLQLGYLKFFTDTAEQLNDTKIVNDNLLPLMQNKLGFFTNLSIPNYQLRTILEGFSIIVKNKGSLAGIKQAIQIFLKIISIQVDSVIIEDYENYEIRIGFKSQVYDTYILKEILKYVIPTGFALTIFTYTEITDNSIQKYSYVDKVNIVYIPIVQNSSVKMNMYEDIDDDGEPYIESTVNRLINSAGLTIAGIKQSEYNETYVQNLSDGLDEADLISIRSPEEDNETDDE